MNSQNPPWHKSEKMFRLFEPLIFRVVANFPEPTTMDPKSLNFAQTTFRSRFRDAVNSLLEFEWASPIDLTLLRQLWPQMEVVCDGSLVVAQVRRHRNLAKTLSTSGVVNVQEFCAEVDNPTFEVLAALAYLLQLKVLKQPVKIYNLHPATKQRILTHYDVAFGGDEREFVVMV